MLLPPPSPADSCILGELFTKRPLFPGYTEIGQLELIRLALDLLHSLCVCVSLSSVCVCVSAVSLVGPQHLLTGQRS